MRFLCVLLLSATFAISVTAEAPVAHYQHDGPALLPDPIMTPGAVRTTDSRALCAPDFRAAQFRRTSNAMKSRVYAEYGAVKEIGKCCEIDHLIPLEIGGLDDEKNLWPQPYEPRPGAYEKNVLERWLRRRMCAGNLTAEQAQRTIARDWYAAYMHMRDQ